MLAAAVQYDCTVKIWVLKTYFPNLEMERHKRSERNLNMIRMES